MQLLNQEESFWMTATSSSVPPMEMRTEKTHSKHPSKAARDREMIRLVHEEKCLCLDSI